MRKINRNSSPITKSLFLWTHMTVDDWQNQQLRELKRIFVNRGQRWTESQSLFFLSKAHIDNPQVVILNRLSKRASTKRRGRKKKSSAVGHIYFFYTRIWGILAGSSSLGIRILCDVRMPITTRRGAVIQSFSLVKWQMENWINPLIVLFVTSLLWCLNITAISLLVEHTDNIEKAFLATGKITALVKSYWA